jgi:predicted acylesterase/phospholipase RssA
MKRFKKEGYMINKKPLESFIKTNTYNLTFKEAFEKTKIKINITVTDSIHQKYRLCNYITTPNLYLWSAAMASCSLPYIYGPSKLHYKGSEEEEDYIETGNGFFDGSIGCDLPMKQVATLYNITNIIVSQCNPYVIPFMATSSIIKNHKRYIFYRIKEKILEFVGSEIKLRLRQLRDNGLIPARLEMPINLGTLNKKD